MKNENNARWKPLLIFVGICAIAGLVINAFHSELQTEVPKEPPKPKSTYKPKPVSKPSYSKPVPTRTQSTSTPTTNLRSQFSAWDGSHYKTVKYVKARMKNPKSFKHVKTTYTAHKDPSYRVIIMKYRGTNSFNAVVTNTVFMQVNKSNGDVAKIITQL